MYGIRTEIPGMTEDLYNRMHAILGPKGLAARGSLLHMAGPSDGGWYMLEVWESKDDCERFVREEVQPLMPPNAPEPKIEEFEVRSFQAS